MTSLYICYQSVLEPLTHTQVVAYLEGLVVSGYRIILLTFEPRSLSQKEMLAVRSSLHAKGIIWHCLRYHKRPTLLATAWDVGAGIIKGMFLSWKYRVGLLHARAHVPGAMAIVLKWLTGAKLLFDIRGFMAEEYVDAGVWSAGGVLFRITKRAERMLVRAADAIVVLTHQAKALLERWYPGAITNKPLEIIPCCVDRRQYSTNGNGHASAPTLAYAGKLGGWYMLGAMVDFVVAAQRRLPQLRWQVWTQSDSSPLKELLHERALGNRVSIGRVSPEELPERLSHASAAISFIKPCVSKLASSPTKVGEYLAAGLPVVSTKGIGDIDDLLGDKEAVGVLVPELSEKGYEDAAQQLASLLEAPDIRQRCRRKAEQELDLHNVGWSRYRRLYSQLLPLR